MITNSIPTDLSAVMGEFPLPMAPGHRVRLGVIGLGGVAMRCHLPALAFLRAQGWPVEVCALCDRDAGRLSAAGALWPDAQAFTEAEQLLAHPGIDGVLVLTWPPLTAKLCEQAASRGLVVFAEKPVAEDAGEVDALAHRLAMHGARVQVGYNRRHQIGATAFKAGLAGRGDIEAVTARLWRDHRSEPGFYEDTLVHPLDLLLWVFGPLDLVDVRASAPRADTTLFSALQIRLATRSGVQVGLDVRPAVGRTLEIIEVLTPEETQVLGYSGVEPHTDPAELAVFREGKRMARYTLSPSVNTPEAMTYARGFIHQMAAFVRFVANLDTVSPCTLAEGAERLRLRDAILKRVRAESSTR